MYKRYLCLISPGTNPTSWICRCLLSHYCLSSLQDRLSLLLPLHGTMHMLVRGLSVPKEHTERTGGVEEEAKPPQLAAQNACIFLSPQNVSSSHHNILFAKVATPVLIGTAPCQPDKAPKQ